MSNISFAEQFRAAPAQAEPVQTTTIAVLSIQDAALSKFSRTDIDLRALAARYKDVAFDVTTTKGMKEATAARLELRTARFTVQRIDKSTRDELNDLKRTVMDKAAELVKIVQPVEEGIDRQIKVEEERKEAAKVAAAAKEAERVARHKANIERIRGYREQAAGKKSAAIDDAIAWIEARVSIGVEYEEFQDEAKATLESTLAGLRADYDKAKAREDEILRVEAQRVENERVAAELAAERKRLDAEAAALRVQQESKAPQVEHALSGTAYPHRGLSLTDVAQESAKEPDESVKVGSPSVVVSLPAARSVRLAATAVLRQLAEQDPRENLDLDAVRLIAVYAASSAT